MTAQEPRSRRPKQLDAEILQAEISSFALRLAAEGKAAKTIRTYTEAVQWFAAARLPGQASWEQVESQDIQLCMTSLLDRYSSAYASNQYRALQQFFKWLAAEDQLPDPMAGLQPPHVTDKIVRHHFSHTSLDRGGPEGDLMELNGWTSPQMLRRYGASARSAARRTYDRIMTDT
jgi:hypothetical protein